VIGLVLVSHSAKLAEGLQELVIQLQPDLPVRAAGGAVDGSLGTSAEAILQAIVDLDNPDGVLVLLDLGSAAMSAEIALEWLDETQRRRVIISDAPLVEGAVLAAANARQYGSLAALAEAVQQARHFPKLASPPTAHGAQDQGLPEATAVLPNRAGLHARSAALLLKTSARFHAKVTLHRGERQADARSLTELLRLGARQGDMVRIQAEGDDAREALGAIKALIERGFGEA
jgi:PTS hybrid protein